MHAGEGLRRPVARVVVQEPARAFLHADLARALEVLSLQRERESMAGRKREAENALDDLLALSKKRHVMSIAVAVVHMGLQDKDQAFAWLEKAYEDRNGWLSEIHADPTFDSLRSDPRFTDLIRRMRLGT